MTAATKTKAKAKVRGETVTPCPLSIHKGDTLQIDGHEVVVDSELVQAFDHTGQATWRFERHVIADDKAARHGAGDQRGVIDVLASAQVLVLSRGGRP